MTFGKRLQALRKEHNISQEKLAEAINVSRQAISKWEQDLVIPDTENLLLVSKYFDIPMEMLLSDYYKVPEGQQTNEAVSLVQEKNNLKTHKINAFILFGNVILILSVCCTYLIQYYDFKLNGNRYTYAIHYLFDFPLLFAFIIGVCLLTIGLIQLITKERK